LAEQARIVRLPLNQVGSLSKLNKTSSRLEQRFERPPSSDELALEMEIPQHKVEETMKIVTRTVSMDAPLDQDDEIHFLDVFISEDTPDTDEPLMKESLGREIQRSLASLTEKERDIINLFYGIGVPHSYTLEEIGAKFDLTRERVRQIKEKAIRRLKHSSRSRLLKAYLG
jgi:RNA polymerase primary sigma factor